MASFSPPFTPTDVTFHPDQSELTITLPDPAHDPTLPSDAAIVRPGAARYAGSTLVMLHVVPKADSFSLFAPTTGSVRKIDITRRSPHPVLDTGIDQLIAGGITQLLEISPLPFTIAPVLRALKPGLPTFYIGWQNSSTVLLNDDDLLHGNDFIATVRGPAFVGLIFQDRLALAPWAWIELIQAAMQNVDTTEDINKWNGLALLCPSNTRLVRILDHTGRPAAGLEFDIIPAGGYLSKRSTNQNGELNLPPGEIQLKWNHVPPINEIEALPIHAFYEGILGDPDGDAFSTLPNHAITLPADFTRGHLQVLDLARWFSERPRGSALARYRINSRMEPLVDGRQTFKRLADDLLASASEGNGAQFAAWVLQDFPLDAGRVDDEGNPVDTRITALTDRILQAQGEIRFLIFKLVNFKRDPDDDMTAIAALTLLVLTDALLLYAGLQTGSTDAVGYSVVLGGFILGEALINTIFSASSLIESMAEQNKDILPALNAIRDKIALWTSHPARLVDNPIEPNSLPLGLDAYVEQYGAWHQKIQLIKRSPDREGNEYVAYLGGIDINENRLDTPGHQKVGPYHDVHARITGPGAADVFKTWDERYAYERELLGDTVTLEPAFPPPDASSLPGQTARHIIQVARTYYKPLPPTDNSPFHAFAPNGEKLIYDTLIHAIKSAQEYIYIEDQFFNPNDSPNPSPDDSSTSDSPETYFEALLGAASNCRRLVILVPTETSQFIGDSRRRHLFTRLQEAWGDRVVIGAPLRRPVLANPGRVASDGRCILMEYIDEYDQSITIGPLARVPTTAAFWLWIDGELMLSSGPPQPLDYAPVARINVLRGPSGGNLRWGAAPRKHYEGAAVTLAQLMGIYVHAKIMMVDDVFVSIGSANLNRRGFFHDGEICAFAVPQQLKAAPDNPALALRTALWAEHLGLPPTQGRTLLSDPVAAFELFRRSRYEGNRFTPFNALDLKPYLDIPLGDGLLVQFLQTAGIAMEAGRLEDLWNKVFDPTSHTDPNPTSGPISPGW